MSELQHISLTLVTEPQTQKIDAEKLSVLVQNELGDNWKVLTIEPYPKFEHSYKIELQITFMDNSPEQLNHIAIRVSDKLVSPWLLYYDDDEQYVALIYNKGEHTQIRKREFDGIQWGHVQIRKQ